MFTLGDIYERGDEGLKDPAIALAWFAITAEFERQTNRGANRCAGRGDARGDALLAVVNPGAEALRAWQAGIAAVKTRGEAPIARLVNGGVEDIGSLALLEGPAQRV